MSSKLLNISYAAIVDERNRPIANGIETLDPTFAQYPIATPSFRGSVAPTIVSPVRRTS